MPQYIFALGRIPAISIAELYHVLPTLAPAKPGQLLFRRLFQNWLLVDTPAELPDPQELLNRLGGSTKIIRLEQEGLSAKELPTHLSALAERTFEGREDKVRYAVSIYNLANNPDKILKSCLLETKKKLKASGLSSRFINNNFHNPPTAQLAGEKILSKGAEFCALEVDKKWLLGRTIAIQDINAYSRRDYERPERDPKQGMLPPKLAQILLNLSGATPGDTVYDPFCGIGTVLQEGLLMGINVIGSDISADNIKKTRQNIDWLKKEYLPRAESHRDKALPDLRLFNKDATLISKSDLPKPPAAIVTETFLGPPVSQLPPESQIELNLAKVEHLIYGFLEQIRPLVGPETRLAMTILCYKNGPQLIRLEHLLNELPQLGYERTEILFPEVLKELNLPEQNRYGLIYDRPDQIVAREIVVLKPV